MYWYTAVEPSFTVEIAYRYLYLLIYFPAIFAQVVPLRQLTSIQQLCEHGDTRLFGFSRHNLGGVYH